MQLLSVKIKPVLEFKPLFKDTEIPQISSLLTSLFNKELAPWDKEDVCRKSP